jgi:ribosome-associated heat shock protein Hsp15
MIPKCGSRISDRVMLASEMDRQRIDKWLWHARVVRTRSAAAALADAGLVRINGARIDTSSRPVRPGDVVTVALDRNVRVLKVTGYAERRGSAEIARVLYEDLTPPSAPAKEPSAGARDEGAGRPTKRERREIDRLQGRDEFE